MPDDLVIRTCGGIQPHRAAAGDIVGLHVRARGVERGGKQRSEADMAVEETAVAAIVGPVHRMYDPCAWQAAKEHIHRMRANQLEMDVGTAREHLRDDRSQPCDLGFMSGAAVIEHEDRRFRCVNYSVADLQRAGILWQCARRHEFSRPLRIAIA
ncbi:hypothetical protein WS66_25020 [Burkholderia sp. LA-2-3-30-S1-D2]|nr:hypothetical protein WS66_25020 [Burkholderia sp. LA-2-3-30-S1-D2]KVE10556.1 hypothetical protein WS66_23115 [Burkholderia sp. LA-2-3-30-S1-D2]